jgi:hypothetical protein
MWALEIYRVISSVGGWFEVCKSEEIDDLLDRVCNIYALEYRIVSPKGEMYTINFIEQDDDYVIPRLGEISTNWPQVIGNVR